LKSEIEDWASSPLSFFLASDIKHQSGGVKMDRKVKNLSYDANHSSIFHQAGWVEDLESIVNRGNQDSSVRVASGRFSRSHLSGWGIEVIAPDEVHISPTYTWGEEIDGCHDGLYFPFAHHRIEWSLYPIYRDHSLGNRLIIVPRWQEIEGKRLEDFYPLDEVKASVILNDRCLLYKLTNIIGKHTEDGWEVCYQFPSVNLLSMRRLWRTFRAIRLMHWLEKDQSPIGFKLGIVKTEIDGLDYYTWDGLHYYSTKEDLLVGLNDLFNLPGYYWQYERLSVGGVSVDVIYKYVDDEFIAIAEWWMGEWREAISSSPHHFREDIAKEVVGKIED